MSIFRMTNSYGCVVIAVVVGLLVMSSTVTSRCVPVPQLVWEKVVDGLAPLMLLALAHKLVDGKLVPARTFITAVVFETQ
jgi:hypothetical protein